jgi:hypothetical protein
LGFLNDRYGILFDAYNAVRPKLVQSGGEGCLRTLEQMNIKFKHLGNVEEKSCLIKNAVLIDKLPRTNLSSGITLNCKTAIDFANWAEEIEARNIVHMGSYNCRKMRNLNIMSEHSFGTAIDIASVDGASVKQDWRKQNLEGDKIRESAKAGCRHFSNVITPDDDTLHHDHLHLDNGYRSTCLPGWINKIKKEVLKYAP